jgi:hypothetical protein
MRVILAIKPEGILRLFYMHFGMSGEQQPPKLVAPYVER